MGGKYKIDKIKQEHTIIEDVLPLLEDISIHPLVKSIIPGRINRRKGSGVQPFLRLKYNTSSGFKVLAKNSSSIQEVFIVTDSPEELVKWLKSKKLVQ